MKLQQQLKSTIRDIPDFPKKGILFRDVTPILKNPKLCRNIVEDIYNKFSKKKINAIVGVESRGFLFGMMLAQRFDVPFIIVRKAGKLPYQTISYEYNLEYGSAKIETHIDDIQAGWNVIIHDDLLATGGTAAATAQLVRMQKATVAGFAFIIELNFLNGKKNIQKFSKNIVSLVKY